MAKIFLEMAEFLAMRETAFKPRAYEKAAQAIEELKEDAAEIYQKEGLKGLEKISGVGKGIAERIEEFIKTGRVKDYERLKKEMPVDVSGLTAVEGVGPKIIKALYQKLKIKNIRDLEKAARAGRLRKLPRFGEKLEQKIIKSVEFHKKSKGRFLIGEILPLANEIKARLLKIKGVSQVEFAGSLRRRKETIGDLDILAISKEPAKVMDYFTKMPEVAHIYAKGLTKSMVRFDFGIDADLRVIAPESFGAALQYFTGSKDHNVVLRKIAVKKRYKLNEYGLWRGKKRIAGKNEEEIYEKLGRQLMPSEIRENTGEIEAAQIRQLPRLIDINDIKGDLHCHSHWGMDKKLINEMIEAAIKTGYEYIGISDHTKFLHIEHGLDEKQLIRQRKEIDKLNSKFQILNKKFRILHGCEANIMADGSIDISDEALAKLDYVIAGVHSQMKMPKEKMTERIIRAMRNPNVDIISHPTGRILKQRDEYKINFDKILKIAKETGTILEINANPYRLDLNDQNIRQAKKIGVKMIINSDAHRKEQLNFMEYGVAQARRGWAEKEDIINCWPVEKLLKFCFTKLF